ncbi:hypothetical protein [Nonomuraea sp. NPDC049480]|uniref:hypothetical protein n=1 Tax=Nonomuraea sp. NPDC049480 TaxID=3364353 RepID=UPI0037A97725
MNGRFASARCTSSIGELYLTGLIADELARDTERLDYLYQRYIEPTLALVVPSIERLMASGRMARVPNTRWDAPGGRRTGGLAACG